MKKRLLFVCIVLCAQVASGEDNASREKMLQQLNPIRADEYFKKSQEINAIREKRLIEIDDMLTMLQEKDTILLDVRGENAYKEKHIKGAVHLSIADMTPETLAKAIPSKNTRVILYCDFAMVPYPTRRIAVSTQAFPLVYQHGYKNLYEAKELWNSAIWNQGPGTEAAHKQYQSYLQVSFEGNPAAIDYDRKYVESCLSGKCK